VGTHLAEAARDARSDFPKARILSFEPHAPTFDKLLVEGRSLAIEAYRIALSDRTGSQVFYEYGSTASCNSLVISGKNPMFIYLEFNSILAKENATGGGLALIAELIEPLGFQFVATYPSFMIAEANRELFVATNALYL